jgi:exodeoxyribonuclease VII small subunit
MARTPSPPAAPSTSTSASASASSAEGASFEEVLKKLEAVVAKLERGDLALEDSLRAYEEGIALVRSAQGRLDGMDKRLEQLLKDGRTAPMPPPADVSDE